MNRINGATGTASPGVAERVNDLAQDVSVLMELQVALLKLDARAWATSLIWPISLLVIGLILGLASLPVLLISFGYYLMTSQDLSLPLAMFAAGLAGLVIAIAAALIGVRMLRHVAPDFSRSTDEFKRNVRSIARALSRKSPARA
jgi:hypothetical protein